ncbi:MAG: HD domain-containing protein [Spirochaetota bacterium]
MEKQELYTLPFVQDILHNKDFQSLQRFTHHGTTTCYQHTVDVAWLVYTLSKLLKLDYSEATRGALLHDFFMYNWRTGGPGLHGFRHPRIALNNASKHFIVSHKVKDSILRHMWPLTPIPPRYPESWIVMVADKIVSTMDYIRFAKSKLALLNSSIRTFTWIPLLSRINRQKQYS